MIFSYDLGSKKLETLKQTSFAENGIFERQDIEKWVENCTDILGEEILIVATEHDKFDKTNERLDLIGIDKQGKLVVIELKRDQSGKDVELQAVKYAAYCSTLKLENVAQLYLEYCSKMDRIKTIDEAREFIINFIENDDFEQLDEKPRIILLSKEYRPEVISTVIWLRKFGIDIKCVEFKPYNLENNKLCFASTILIPIPNTDEYRINPKVTTNSPADLTVSQKRYLDFYKDLAKRINKLDPTIEANPEPKNYCQIPTEFGSIHFEWIIHKRPQDSLEVALHIERNLESSRKILNNLSKYTAEIEEKTGCKAKAEMWGKRWARIYIEKPENEMTEELKIWAVQKMKQLIDVLQPKLSLMKEIM